MRYKGGPKAHKDSGNDGDDEALARKRVRGSWKTGISLAVKDHGDDRRRDAHGKQQGIPFGLKDVTRHNANDESNANGNREGRSQAGHIDRGNEQEVRKIEDSAADERIEKIRPVGRMDIVEEAGGIVGCAAHRKGQHQRDKENPDGIVPVKKFKAIILHAFVGVCPRAPADGARNHHQKSESEAVRNKHGLRFVDAGAAYNHGGDKCQAQTAEAKCRACANRGYRTLEADSV